MEKASLQALDVLRTRADEREGERLMNDWQKACEGWAQSHVGGGDSRLGNGAKMLGEIHALIGATKGVLPEKYARMGHLNGLLRWAAVYANMQQTGEVPAEGVIAGPIYEKFVQRMRYVDAKNEAYGLNDAEVKEAKITPQFKKMVYCKYNTTAKFTADAPQGRAYELLRAAISGGHTANVADLDDIVNKNST